MMRGSQWFPLFFSTSTPTFCIKERPKRVDSYNTMRSHLGALGLMFVLLSVAYCKTDATVRTETVKPSPAQKGPAYLGIMYTEDAMGVRVAQVFPGSPAEEAGLEVGDLIVTANGYPVLGTYTLNKRILSLDPGDEVSLEVLKRDGSRILRKAVLAPLPAKYKEEYEETPGYEP